MNKMMNLTERDIRRIISSVINEERSNGEPQIVPDITDAKQIANCWGIATENGLAGKPAVCEYNGQEWTAKDWLVTLFFNKRFEKYSIMNIAQGIGQEISSVTSKKANRKGVPAYLVPSVYKNPTDNGYGKLVYDKFFTEVGDNRTIAGGGKEIVARVKKYHRSYFNIICAFIKKYAIKVFRADQDEKIQSKTGNFNLSRPITNEKDINAYTGRQFGSHPAMKDAEDPNSIGVGGETDVKAQSIREQLRTMFELVLSEKGPEGQKISDFQFKANEKNPGLANVIQFIIDNFDEVFDKKLLKHKLDDIESLKKPVNRAHKDFETQKIMMWRNFIRERVLDIVYDEYQKAFNENDVNNPIILMNKQNIPRKGEQLEKVQPYSKKDCATALLRMWAVLGKHRRATESESTMSSLFGMGDFLVDRYNEKYSDMKVSETISRVVKGMLAESKRKSKKKGIFFQ